MASIWNNVKNYLNSVPYQSTYVNTDKPKTSDATKPKTSSATVGYNAPGLNTPGLNVENPAQAYAQAALNGTSGVYVPASQTYNAMLNAGVLGDITPVASGDGGGKGSGNGSTGVSGGVYDVYARAVDEQNRLLKEQRDLAERQRRASMEATITANNMAADKSLKEAYIANMLAKKNLPQQLKALGISGGASETTLADIENTYMNNRFGIEDGRNDANLKARLAYDDGVAGDYAQYLAKAFDLQGTFADRLASLGTSKASGGTTSTGSGNVSGYKIDSLGIKVPGGSSADVVGNLRSELIARGWTEAQIAEYLMNNGIIG